MNSRTLSLVAQQTECQDSQKSVGCLVCKHHPIGCPTEVGVQTLAQPLSVWLALAGSEAWDAY